MAEKQDGDTSAEPSMEEILASIRKIIADEKDPAAPAEAVASTDGDDVLELTQMVQDDGSIVDLAAQQPEAPVELPPADFAPVPVPEPEPVFDPVPVAEPAPAPMAMADDDALVSDGTASLTSSVLTELAHKVQGERALTMPSFTPLGNGSKTLEEMVLELMKPMLKSWLDQNLPVIVERLVQKEVERIARRVQE